MKLILPVAGESSRYPGVKPKWLLTHPNGNLMFHEAIRRLDLSAIDEIILIGLRAHLEGLGARAAVERQFAHSDIDRPWRIVSIDQSRSQPDTILQGIQRLDVQGPIFIKDADNQYACAPEAGNSVATMHLGHAGVVDPSSKSYVELDENGMLSNIVEKRVISDRFCVGGYGFDDAKAFVQTYESIAHIDNLYVSHVIFQMLASGVAFNSLEARDFIDWGTLKDWNRFKRKFATLFIDLDGTLFENAGRYFDPVWGETDPIHESVEAINRLHETGKVQIIITTSRPESARDLTEAQLSRHGVRHDQLICGLTHSKRIVINDYAPSNPYKSADAINLQRDSRELGTMLREYFEDLL